MGAAFELEGARVSFAGSAALRETSLAIEPGEAVALVGPSGAGKTTLLRLLGATLRPSAGEVRVDGTALSSLAPRALRALRSRIGFVHQDGALVPNLRASQNVLAGRLGRTGFWGGLRRMAWPPRAELREVHALLERVGIPEKLFARTDTLSGGQQQRLGIARALFQQPVALLADEPVASVDPARARDTVALLSRISKEDGLTLVMSLHDIALARAHFPRLVGLRDGRIAFDARADEIDETRLAALYALDADEMMADGA